MRFIMIIIEIWYFLLETGPNIQAACTAAKGVKQFPDIKRLNGMFRFSNCKNFLSLRKYKAICHVKGLDILNKFGKIFADNLFCNIFLN